jgi:dTDP-4-dehydrorhamnose 3,5-epimerase
MIFHQTTLESVYIIEAEKRADDRGFFARTWCKREFQAQGLHTELAQCNVAYSKARGTLRGLHYQSAPWAEAKLIRCVKGSLYDVIVDLRPQSATFKQWLGVELTADNRKMIYVPEGCANGYLTLEDNTEMFYQVSQFYTPEYERGIRFNDPLFGIQWPADIRVISEKLSGKTMCCKIIFCIP